MKYKRKNDYDETDEWPDVFRFGTSEKTGNSIFYSLSSQPFSNTKYDYGLKLFKDGGVSFSRAFKWEKVEHLLFDVEKFLEHVVLFCFFACRWLHNLPDHHQHRDIFESPQWDSASVNLKAVIPKGCLLHINTKIIQNTPATPEYDGPQEISGNARFDFFYERDYAVLSKIVNRTSSFVFSEFSFRLNDQVQFPIVQDNVLAKFIEWIAGRIVNL